MRPDTRSRAAAGWKRIPLASLCRTRRLCWSATVGFSLLVHVRLFNVMTTDNNVSVSFICIIEINPKNETNSNENQPDCLFTLLI